MRYKRILDKEQVRYIIDNPSTPNKVLAERFNTTNSIIAVYKHRLRKIGLYIPLLKKRGLKDEVLELAQK